MDVLPDRYTSVWFEPTQPGTYHLFCSQYCGTKHAAMIGTIHVHEAHGLSGMVEQSCGGIAGSAQVAKSFLKQYRCIERAVTVRTARPGLRCWKSCISKEVHFRDAQPRIADEDYLRESILDPAAKIVEGYENIMPTFKGQIGPEEMNALIAFIKTLRRGETPRRVEDFPPPVSTPPINPLKETP